MGIKPKTTAIIDDGRLRENAALLIAGHLASADQAFAVLAPGMKCRLSPSHDAHPYVTILKPSDEIPSGCCAVMGARTDAGLIAKTSSKRSTFLILGKDQQIPEGANRVAGRGLKAWLQAIK